MRRRASRDLFEDVSSWLEDRLEVEVMSLARLYGWHGFHIRYSAASTRGIHLLKRDGHMDGWGFPDWIFCKEGHAVMFRELKTETGTVSPHQKFWHAILRACGADVDVWRPRDLDRIAREFAA